MVKRRSESANNSFDETYRDVTKLEFFVLFFIQGEGFQWFGKCIINRTGSSDCTTSLKIPPQKQQMINVKMRLKYLQNHILLALLAIGTHEGRETIVSKAPLY